MVVTAFIGLGSNLNDPAVQVHTALQQLQKLPESKLVKFSSLYQSLPMGPSDQSDYINAVACLETGLTPHSLLEHLQHIEMEHGRIRTGERWGPRTLDLDILLYGDKTISTENLVIPHSGLHERSFVLYPLHEIAPELEIPGLGPVVDLIARCSMPAPERITNS